MRDWMEQNRAALGAFCLAVLLLGFGLGSYGLLEDNEGRFFEISWEMQRSGDWLTPRLNFIPHFHKPPGTFWLVGASLRVFGESEWAGRLPVALAGFTTLLLTFAFLKREGSPTEATLAILLLVTSLEFWFLSRLVLTDMFLTVTVTGAMLFAWRSRSDQGPSGNNWLGFWLALGLSTLFKGPIGLIIVLPVMALFSWVSREKRAWNLRPTLGIPIFFALALPWYVAVCAQHEGLLGYFLGFQTFDRMLTTVHGRPGAWWFYLPALLGGFFPWSTGLPLTVQRALRRGEDFDRFLLLWIGFPLLFFSCAGSKLPTYLLPIFPALAMLTARAGRSPGVQRTLATIAWLSLLIFGLAVAIYVGVVSVAPVLRPAIPYLTGLSLCILGSGLVFAWQRDKLAESGQLTWNATTFALVLLLLASALGPSDAAYSSRQVAQAIRKLNPSDNTSVVEVADHLHGLPYYLNRRLIQVAYPRETQFDSPQDYEDFLFPDLATFFASPNGHHPTLIVLRRSDYADYADPRWYHQDFGTWLLLQPGAPTASP